MKVKIGNRVFDADDQPIMLYFEDSSESQTVAMQLFNMATDSRKYCMYPDDTDATKILNFMNTDKYDEQKRCNDQWISLIKQIGFSDKNIKTVLKYVKLHTRYEIAGMVIDKNITSPSDIPVPTLYLALKVLFELEKQGLFNRLFFI